MLKIVKRQLFLGHPISPEEEVKGKSRLIPWSESSIKANKHITGTQSGLGSRCRVSFASLLISRLSSLLFLQIHLRISMRGCVSLSFRMSVCPSLSWHHKKKRQQRWDASIWLSELNLFTRTHMHACTHTHTPTHTYTHTHTHIHTRTRRRMERGGIS